MISAFENDLAFYLPGSACEKWVVPGMHSLRPTTIFLSFGRCGQQGKHYSQHRAFINSSSLIAASPAEGAETRRGRMACDNLLGNYANEHSAWCEPTTPVRSQATRRPLLKTGGEVLRAHVFSFKASLPPAEWGYGQNRFSTIYRYSIELKLQQISRFAGAGESWSI